MNYEMGLIETTVYAVNVIKEGGFIAEAEAIELIRKPSH